MDYIRLLVEPNFRFAQALYFRYQHHEQYFCNNLGQYIINTETACICSC